MTTVPPFLFLSPHLFVTSDFGEPIQKTKIGISKLLSVSLNLWRTQFSLTKKKEIPNSTGFTTFYHFLNNNKSFIMIGLRSIFQVSSKKNFFFFYSSSVPFFFWSGKETFFFFASPQILFTGTRTRTLRLLRKLKKLLTYLRIMGRNK